MSKTILALSPHLDDVVLSVADFLLMKQNLGYEIWVLTFFTQYEGTCLSEDSRDYLEKSGFVSTKEFSKRRKSEDAKAMELLGFSFIHLDFIDGGFRCDGRKPVYEDHATLFSGNISQKDATLGRNVTQALEQAYHKLTPDMVVAPLGIGRHADHLLVKQGAKEVVSRKKLYCYADQPYAWRLWNWKSGNMWKHLIGIRYCHVTSNQKRAAIAAYVSQVPVLFKSKIHAYLEIVLAA